MSNPWILLWLEGPLQAWGFDSRFYRRETLNFPTRSGILGLLCCALGASGPQQALLEEFALLRQTVLSFGRVRRNGDSGTEDSEILLRDFHMVGSGYKERDPWESLLIPKTKDGKKAVGGGTKITNRFYLQDAAFSVSMEVPGKMLNEIETALQNPVWDLYLGRKCCVPTDFIYRGYFSSESGAIDKAQEIAKEKSRAEKFRVTEDEHYLDEPSEALRLNDVPIQFGEEKRYRDRQVYIINVK